METFTKLNKKKIVLPLVFLIYVSKKCWDEKNVDLLLTGEEGKRYYVLIKDYNTFLYDLTLSCGIKHFFCYCSKAFTTEILNCDIKD